MDTATQVAQPVPLFYGLLGGGTEVVTLESGFDYVITTVWAACNEISAFFTVLVKDESGVPIFSFFAPAAESGAVGQFIENVEMPIGPRTALNIDVESGSGYLYIGGYALTPETVLHV